MYVQSQNMDLVSALHRKEFKLADELWGRGIKMSFPQTMMINAKQSREIDILKWLILHIRPADLIIDINWSIEYGDVDLLRIVHDQVGATLTSDHLKKSFKRGEKKIIMYIWKNSSPPDFIETVDILQIILDGDDLDLLNLLVTLRGAPLKSYRGQIEQMLNPAKHSKIIINFI